MRPDGFWQGRLASSALSTATAVSALCVAKEHGIGRESFESLIANGAAWLAAHQNADGGWGDTADSPSNLATTALCIAAFKLAEQHLAQTLPGCARAQARAREYAAGGGDDLPAALSAAYGKDRTFAVPILANCALAGIVPWQSIPRLPFELAALPQGWYKFLRLHVVSYALPALIAIGLLLDDRKNSRGPIRKLVRRLAQNAVLGKLETIQPSTGGFLEAIPLTSFVAMTIIPAFAGSGASASPAVRVARNCLDFIERSARSDGSWAIDSNLSVWLTTNAVKALDAAGKLHEIDTHATRRWIANRQYRAAHPYTNSPPGAWAWTHLDGGVPDTDDTSSAMLALLAVGEREAIPDGAQWLLNIQNKDGGWPTFCRGWGKLPFDQSSPDLTAHAMHALGAAGKAGAARDANVSRAIERGMDYLAGAQRDDGSWVPLWFGNQLAPGKINPVLGTSQVLAALAEMQPDCPMLEKSGAYLAGVQNDDGGWGAAEGITSTVEETALATAALARCARDADRNAVEKGIDYLLRRIENGTWHQQAPIGLYFARLWYSEELYPVIWTLEALGRARRNNVEVH
ncbi:MAG: squalene--hopene cyclase [Planctomycetes bacterium]|nr:squalene--hopene cyclase [Planctomycetota bacterium]